MKKAENKGQTLVQLFNETFGVQAEKVSLEQVQEFHRKALEPVFEFLDYTGLDITSIKFQSPVREEPRSGISAMFQSQFGLAEKEKWNLSVKTWLDFYGAVGRSLKDALAFTGQKWEDYTFNEIKLKVQALGLPFVEWKALYDRKIDSLDLTVRAANCLLAENIRYLGELVQKRQSQLLEIPNLGRKSMNEIIDVLAARGLALGTDVGGWRRPE